MNPPAHQAGVCGGTQQGVHVVVTFTPAAFEACPDGAREDVRATAKTNGSGTTERETRVRVRPKRCTNRLTVPQIVARDDGLL